MSKYSNGGKLKRNRFIIFIVLFTVIIQTLLFPDKIFAEAQTAYKDNFKFVSVAELMGAQDPSYEDKYFAEKGGTMSIQYISDNKTIAKYRGNFIDQAGDRFPIMYGKDMPLKAFAGLKVKKDIEDIWEPNYVYRPSGNKGGNWDNSETAELAFRRTSGQLAENTFQPPKLKNTFKVLIRLGRDGYWKTIDKENDSSFLGTDPSQWAEEPYWYNDGRLKFNVGNVAGNPSKIDIAAILPDGPRLAQAEKGGTAWNWWHLDSYKQNNSWYFSTSYLDNGIEVPPEEKSVKIIAKIKLYTPYSGKCGGKEASYNYITWEGDLPVWKDDGNPSNVWKKGNIDSGQQTWEYGYKDASGKDVIAYGMNLYDASGTEFSSHVKCYEKEEDIPGTFNVTPAPASTIIGDTLGPDNQCENIQGNWLTNPIAKAFCYLGDLLIKSVVWVINLAMPLLTNAIRAGT